MRSRYLFHRHRMPNMLIRTCNRCSHNGWLDQMEFYRNNSWCTRKNEIRSRIRLQLYNNALPYHGIQDIIETKYQRSVHCIITYLYGIRSNVIRYFVCVCVLLRCSVCILLLSRFAYVDACVYMCCRCFPMCSSPLLVRVPRPAALRPRPRALRPTPSSAGPP